LIADDSFCLEFHSIEYQKKNTESDMSSGVEVEGISDFFRYGVMAYWRKRCIR
jgi:hypothetical protein